MRAHPKLTPEQTRKAIAMHKEGATHADICAALHAPKHQIGELLTMWLRANMADLQNHLRLLIDGNLSAGTYSMILPPSSKLVRLPVLAGYADKWVITSKSHLSCTWWQFAPRTKSAPPAKRVCRHCKVRPLTARRLECATCIKIIRRHMEGPTLCR